MEKPKGQPSKTAPPKPPKEIHELLFSPRTAGLFTLLEGELDSALLLPPLRRHSAMALALLVVFRAQIGANVLFTLLERKLDRRIALLLLSTLEGKLDGALLLVESWLSGYCVFINTIGAISFNTCSTYEPKPEWQEAE